MQDRNIAVESNAGADAPNASGGEQSPAQGSARSSNKFVYASGSRPLDGYTIKRGVGQGGFGEIYYAVSDAGKEVGLKLIRRNLDVELRGIKQCLNLKHPNLLSLFDIRQDATGDTWVVMEFVGGESLQDCVENNPNGMHEETALAWFRGVGAAVAYLHDHGIVHRDLKPGNVFSEEGVVKVGDYGLSKFISCSRRSGHTESIGTVHYMAPEVANGRYGKEIDVYALGIMLYEMLTGRVPFDGESVGEVLMKHLTAQPDVSALAEPYRTIVTRALEKDPEKRIRSVHEMLAALPGAPNEASDLSRVRQSSSPPPFRDKAAGGAADLTGYQHDHLGGKSNPHAETIIFGKQGQTDPVTAALTRIWNGYCRFWNEAPWPIKGLIIVVAAFSAPMTIGPIAACCILYLLYRLIRAIVLETSNPAATGTPAREAAIKAKAVVESAAQQIRVEAGKFKAAAEAKPKWKKRRWREKPKPALVLRTPRERMTELLGSMLTAAFVVCAATALISFIACFVGTQPSVPQIAWLLGVGLLGTWSILIPAKYWEGKADEPLLHRFTQMMIGMALGCAAFGMQSWFFMQLTHNRDFARAEGLYRNVAFYLNRDVPTAMAFIAVFGATFFLINWQRQANPLRTSRARIGSVVASMFLAWVASFFLDFPQPWMPMLAGIISLTVQFSSPWLHPKSRL